MGLKRLLACSVVAAGSLFYSSSASAHDFGELLGLDIEPEKLDEIIWIVTQQPAALRRESSSDSSYLLAWGLLALGSVNLYNVVVRKGKPDISF